MHILRMFSFYQQMHTIISAVGLVYPRRTYTQEKDDILHLGISTSEAPMCLSATRSSKDTTPQAAETLRRSPKKASDIRIRGERKDKAYLESYIRMYISMDSKI